MPVFVFRILFCIFVALIFSSCKKESNPADDSGTDTTTPVPTNTFSLRFLGDSGRVDIIKPLALMPAHFTVEMWLKFDAVYATYMPVFGANVDERNTADGFNIKFESGKVFCRVATSPTVAAAYWANFTPPVGQWFHVAATFDGSKARLYINGTQVNEFPSSGPVSYGSANLWLGLGYHTDFGGYSSFRGLMDEVRVWDRARSTSQIANGMNTLLAETDPGLVGYWNFDDSTFTDFVLDASKNNNHGLIWGTVRRDTTTPF